MFCLAYMMFFRNLKSLQWCAKDGEGGRGPDPPIVGNKRVSPIENFKTKPTKNQSPFYYHHGLAILKNVSCSPGWCGSVDWVLAWEPKGCWFNFQSSHSWVAGQVPGRGSCERQPINVSVAHRSLSPSLRLSLKINKIFLFNFFKMSVIKYSSMKNPL